MTKAASVNSMFEELLGDIKYDPDSRAGCLYPFFIRVGLIQRRPPRHEYFEYIRDLGMVDIEKVMEKKRLNRRNLTFVFPERWLGVAEQQAFTHSIATHPNAETIKQVDILTSSPLIIGGFLREHIRIITWPEDVDKYNG